MMQRYVASVVAVLTLASCGDSGVEEPAASTSSSSVAVETTSSVETTAVEATTTVEGGPVTAVSIPDHWLAALSMVSSPPGASVSIEADDFERAFQLSGLSDADPDDAELVEKLLLDTMQLPIRSSVFGSEILAIDDARAAIGFSVLDTRLLLTIEGPPEERAVVFVTDVPQLVDRQSDGQSITAFGPIAVIAESEAVLDRLPIAQTRRETLADDSSAVGMLGVLEGYEVYNFTIGNRPVEPQPGETLVAPALGPYSAVATGTALVEGRHLGVIVILHEDPVAAASNAGLLRLVLDEGESAVTTRAWSEVFAVESIDVVGRHVVAVVDQLDSPRALRSVFNVGDSLFWVGDDS